MVPTIQVPMLMYHKVTHKNLIDSSPTIPNFISRKEQTNTNSLSAFHISLLTTAMCCIILYLLKQYSKRQKGGGTLEIVVSNKTSRPLYEQISTQIKSQIMNGELKAGEALPSIRSLAKSLQISVLTVQKAYDLLQTDGFIETTAGKGCYVSAQNQDFYLEEQQKKIEEHFSEAIEIARTSGISLNKLLNLLTLLYEED